MTREEEFYAAILAAINGDDHTCPTPVWRIEEFLKAIHDAIANGGGGGGGSGSTLVVHENAETSALDKTWKEISDAGFAVLHMQTGMGIWVLALAGIYESDHSVDFRLGSTSMEFAASSENGYPVRTE